MHTKEKMNFFTKYTLGTKFFFFIAVLLIFLFGIVTSLLYPSERDRLSTDCKPFKNTWEQLSDDGNRHPVEVPGKIPAEFGESVRVATTLPSTIYPGQTLCFRPVWQDVDIYIDGILRQRYSTQATRPFGINSPMRYVFVDLEVTDAGKELIYQTSSYSKYSGYLSDVLIGDRLSIWVHLLETSGLHTLIATFLLLLSLFSILVCIILKFIYKKTLALNYLAWTIFFCALWMLSEIAFRQIIFKNVSILSCYAYWSLMLIPLPLLIYMDDIQKGMYRKLYVFPILYSSVLFIIVTILQIFDIFQFVNLILFIHAGIILSIICILLTITLDTFKKRIRDYLAVGIGVYGMMLTAIIEMLFYHLGSTLSLGTVLAIGLLFLLIMAIIKTGQDLFYAEKKKQQAIVAKEAQTKFLANMSHEIRTPINVIIGMNEMILRENNDPNTLDYAHNIKRSSNMLLGLVNDVLDFTKIESGQLELVESTYRLSDLLQDEILLLKSRTAEKPITTKICVDPTLPSGYFGDELRIKQILTNLLSNAAKYTHEGSITLDVSYSKKDESNILLHFSVIDTGIGIKKEDISQLFDSFKRLELNKNRTIQGTGLGLNITKQLADLMNGSITVKSDYGKGSAFTLSIPQKITSPEPIGQFEDALEKDHNPKKAPKQHFTAPDANILIVDDNSMNLSLMKALLKRTQIQIDLASSGKECLSLTKTKSYNIIFMDHMMPELDGVETLHRLRSDSANPNRNTMVIALTANAIAGCKEMYLEYGFNDYFSKPIQADKLDAFLMENLPKELIQKPTDSTDLVQIDFLTLDEATGLSYCMDSMDFYQEMLSMFCEQATEYLPELETYYQNKDWKNYATIAHALKGNALNIGACNFSELSLKHEQAGKEENTDFILREYATYRSTLEALIQKIENT